MHGATGAIGSAAVQLLKDVGATVTATCTTPYLDLVRPLGADRVIDHSTTDFTRDRHQYDLVMDTVGNSTFGRCRRLLRPGASTSPRTSARGCRTRSWR
ncbi:MAG: zinc-binding dehydrogenase [Ornithinimicrobium sp.]|uniref:zinc-binding dehydrogenase n=1 Tax=Ornithinimicrobium sp. TaxID=1977084 RepID=UPI003D9BF1BC